MASYTKLLQSENYVTRRQSLKVGALVITVTQEEMMSYQNQIQMFS